MREQAHLESLDIAVVGLVKVFQLQSFRPARLVQIQQHPLLRLGFSVVDCQTFS